MWGTSENPNLRLRSRLELWSRSWHGWFLEQSFLVWNLFNNDILLTSCLEVGTAIKSRRFVCLIQARLYQMIIHSVFGVGPSHWVILVPLKVSVITELPWQVHHRNQHGLIPEYCWFCKLCIEIIPVLNEVFGDVEHLAQYLSWLWPTKQQPVSSNRITLRKICLSRI